MKISAKKFTAKQSKEMKDLLKRAVELRQNKKVAQAQILCELILGIHPEHLDATHLLAAMGLQSGNYLQAMECSQKVLALDGLNASAHFIRASALHALKRWDEALTHFERATSIQPTFVFAHSNKGLTLTELQQFEQAIVSFDKAIALQPDFVLAHFNRAVALGKMQDYAGAIVGYDKTISLSPGHFEAYSNRGNALNELGRLNEAVQSFDAAISINPHFAVAHVNKSMAQLLMGDFDHGWDSFEWRWEITRAAGWKRTFDQPLLNGVDSVAGKTVLLYAEQGLGDTLQFCRYASLIAQRAGGGGATKIILEVPRTLVGVMGSLAGVSTVVESGTPLPDYDYRCPLLSLPMLFKTNMTNIPSRQAYLAANEALVEQWTARLGPKSKPRIGVVWSGNPQHGNDRNRSVQLSLLSQYFCDDFDYICLQKELRGTDQEVLQSIANFYQFNTELKDFSDTAALCSLMDVVISVDTSVAHLSGAMGLTTWILLPFVPDWRWMLNTDKSPWYPSATLYRQSTAIDWPTVFQKIKNDLNAKFAPALTPSN